MIWRHLALNQIPMMTWLPASSKSPAAPAVAVLAAAPALSVAAAVPKGRAVGPAPAPKATPVTPGTAPPGFAESSETEAADAPEPAPEPVEPVKEKKKKAIRKRKGKKSGKKDWLDPPGVRSDLCTIEALLARSLQASTGACLPDGFADISAQCPKRFCTAPVGFGANGSGSLWILTIPIGTQNLITVL